jgi:uncharacterized protein with von Willebrand factor type A (vWA) domain
MQSPAVLLRGIDRSAFAVSLVARLRSRGLTVGFTAIEDFVQALAAASPRNRSRLYWTARICLVRRHSELAAFDAVFAAVFDDAVLEMDPNARRTSVDQPPVADEKHAPVPKQTDEEQDGSGLPWMTLPRAVAGAEDSDSTLSVAERLPGELAALADVPFEQLSPREMELLGRWLEAAVRSWPTRRTRRLAIDRSGHRIALRPTIARSRRTGWEAVELVCSKPVDKPRRVVMLCDVSQSMQAQAAAYFHLMRALALTADAEVFAFATSLTRLTTVLAHRSAEVAIDQASAKVVDRFGGTRIATNLHTLLASHHGGAVRGAIVIVGSDGWDSDSPEQLAAAMARLRRRAYRVIWMNPRVAAPGFEPRVASMAAAMPYCDELLAADTFASLAHVITEVSRSSVSSRASRGSRVGTARR